MKKSCITLFVLFLFSLTWLTSCITDQGNKQTILRVMSTVVSSSMNKVIVQYDANGRYYYADEFVASSLLTGDRVLLDEVTVDYDNQEANACGSLEHPYKMTQVSYTKIDVSDILLDGFDDNSVKDTLEMLYVPYINISYIQGEPVYYLTVSGAALKGAAPSLQLAELELAKDTVCYELRAENVKSGTVGMYESVVKCFRIPALGSEDPVKISFLSKRSDSQSSYLQSATTYLIYAPKLTSQE